MAKYTQTTSVSLNCPACGDGHVVKVGKQSGVQRYLCRNCSKKFRANDKTVGRRFTPEVTGAAVSMFYSGMSYKQIAEAIGADLRYQRTCPSPRCTSGLGTSRGKRLKKCTCAPCTY